MYEILEKKVLSETVKLMKIKAPLVASHAKAGQFIILRIDEEGERINIWIENGKPPEGYVFLPVFARDFPKNSLFRNELVNYTEWKKIGFHDTNLNIYEDFDMRIRLTKHLHTHYIDEPLSEYRTHSQGLSRSTTQLHLTSLEYIQKKNYHLLTDLQPDEREYVTNKLGSLISTMARNAAINSTLAENFSFKNRIEALKYYHCYLKHEKTGFDMELLLTIILPKRLHSFIKIFSNRIKRRRLGP